MKANRTGRFPRMYDASSSMAGEENLPFDSTSTYRRYLISDCALLSTANLHVVNNLITLITPRVINAVMGSGIDRHQTIFPSKHRGMQLQAFEQKHSRRSCNHNGTVSSDVQYKS